jgi:hypothetical protein
MMDGQRLKGLWPVRRNNLFALIALDLLFGGKIANGYPGFVEVPSDLDAHRLAPRLPTSGIKRHREERAKGAPDNDELAGMIVKDINVIVLES